MTGLVTLTEPSERLVDHHRKVYQNWYLTNWKIVVKLGYKEITKWLKDFVIILKKNGKR
jgi:hypothetical protein